MLTTTDLPNDALAVAEPIRAGVAVTERRRARRTQAAGIDWWRVALLALVVTGHLVGIGLMALPDTAATPVEPTRRQLADAPDSDRLTLFVDLEPAPAPPLQPLPPPPVRLVVAPITEPTAAPPLPAPVAVVTDKTTPDSLQIATPLAATPPVPAAQASIPAPAAGAAASRPTGDPAQIRNDRDAWMRALMAALLQHRSYPAEARKQRARGTVHVRFSVDRQGHVLATNIARGAGFPILEAAALEVLRSADPLPPIPESLGVDRLTVTVPIEYSLITR